MPRLLAVLLLASAIAGEDAPDECFTELHHAAEFGDSDKVSSLLEEDMDPDTEDYCDLKTRPLMLAAAAGNSDVVSLLLEAGALPNVRHLAHGASPLIGAAQNGHAEVVAKLLANKAKVDLQDDRNMTALMYACQNSHPDVVRELLAAGATTSFITHTGVTAYMWALHKFTNENGTKSARSVLDQLVATSNRAQLKKPSTLYLNGALPLPLENAKPFEDFLLGAYDFEELLPGGVANISATSETSGSRQAAMPPTHGARRRRA